MEKLATCLDLKLMQTKVDEFITHIEARNHSSNDQLDYVLSNQSLVGTSVEDEEWSLSDH